MTDDEKLTVGAAMVLLESATSNSLDPMVRQGWNDDRDIVLQRLRGMLR